jgi:hypothetical protein
MRAMPAAMPGAHVLHLLVLLRALLLRLSGAFRPGGGGSKAKKHERGGDNGDLHLNISPLWCRINARPVTQDLQRKACPIVAQVFEKFDEPAFMRILSPRRIHTLREMAKA